MLQLEAMQRSSEVKPPDAETDALELDQLRLQSQQLADQLRVQQQLIDHYHRLVQYLSSEVMVPHFPHQITSSDLFSLTDDDANFAQNRRLSLAGGLVSMGGSGFTGLPIPAFPAMPVITLPTMRSGTYPMTNFFKF